MQSIISRINPELPLDAFPCNLFLLEGTGIVHCVDNATPFIVLGTEKLKIQLICYLFSF